MHVVTSPFGRGSRRLAVLVVLSSMLTTGLSWSPAAAVIDPAPAVEDPLPSPEPPTPEPPPLARPLGQPVIEPVRGFVEGESVEDRSLWTATSRTWRNRDNTLTSHVYGGAVNFLGADGAWTPIDSNLAADAEGWRNTAGWFSVRFASQAPATELVRVTSGSASVSFGSPLGALPVDEPLVDGNTITYHGVLPGADLRYDVGPSSVKENLVLSAAPAAGAALSFDFPVSLEGVTAQARDDGGFDLVDPEGAAVFTVPAGYMTDSNPLTGSLLRGRLDLSLEEVAGQTVLRMVPDRAWLLSPERQYPVFLDPTITLPGHPCVVPPGCPGTTTDSVDAFIWAGNPNWTYDVSHWGGRYEDVIGGENGGAERVAYLHYNTNIVRYSNVNSAYWRGYFYWSQVGYRTPFWMYPTSGAWSSNGQVPDAVPSVTWNNRAGHYAPSVVGEATAGDWVDRNITGWVVEWAKATGGWVNRGLTLDTQGGVLERFKRIAAHENGDGSGSYLIVDHYDPSPNSPTFAWDAPADGALLTGTPTLKAIYSDPNGEPGYTNFQVVRLSDGAVVAGFTVPYNCNGCTASWTPPALAEGAYRWQVYNYDDTTASATVSRTFTVDPTGPAISTLSSSTHQNQSSWYASNTPSFQWSASDTSGICDYRWDMDQGSGTDPFTSRGMGTSYASPARGDGSWWFHVKAKNCAGVWGSPSHFKVNIDTTGPGISTLSSSTHQDQSSWYASNTPTFEWSASDTSGICDYRWDMDQTSGTDPTTTRGTGTSYASPARADGTWWFHVKAMNCAGVWGGPSQFQVNIDATGPSAAPAITKRLATPKVASGQEATYEIDLPNVNLFSTEVDVTDTLVAALTPVAGSIKLDGTACTATTTPSCRFDGQQLVVSDLPLPPASTRTVSFRVVAQGEQGACTAVENVAQATNLNGTTLSSPVTLTICDAFLGLEPWWTYVTEAVGPQASASVNVANGNLVVAHTDSTPVGAHGRLAYVLRRVYNSQTPVGTTLPGSIGAGWHLNIGQADDLLGEGVGATSLVVPPAGGPLAVSYVDRDGTRHVFTPKATLGSAALPVTTRQPGAAAGNASEALRPAVLRPAAGMHLCVDQTYSPPPGVHLALWRYVAVSTATACSAVPAGTVPAGFAAIRPDRLRYEFDADGRLVSMLDAAGVELRYLYEDLSVVGRQLTAVFEPRTCLVNGVPPTRRDDIPAACRAFRFTYTPAVAPDSRVREITVTDPVGRATHYHLDLPVDGALAQHLVRVDNPDGSDVDYGYGTCNGTRDQLCSVSDPRNAVTRFGYDGTPSSPGAPAPPLLSITDRRNSTTSFSYPVASETLVVQAGQGRRFQNIDSFGRVGVTEEGAAPADQASSALASVLHRTAFTWDRPPGPGDAGLSCRQPDSATDHNLCSLTRQAQPNSSSAQDEVTSWTYSAEGARLIETRAVGGGGAPVHTTFGYHVQYVTATGTVACAEWRTQGGGTVARTAAANCPLHPATAAPPDTLFAISDQIESLTPRGNASGEMPARFRTTHQRDYPTGAGSVDPTATPAGPCTTAERGNTGLTCQTDTPRGTAGAKSSTRYTYDAFGQKVTMTTPKAIAETPAGQTPPAYRYTYFGDSDGNGVGDLDLSGSVAADGWLKSVTDPTASFVAFGYDRAGNVVRTWDRNATQGADPATFPGDFDSFPMDGAKVRPYAQTLYGTGAGAAPYANPWRYVTSQRDPMGNSTTYAVDGNGNRATITPPRGATAGNAYDVVQTFDEADQMKTRLLPEESAANKPWAFDYDAFGNKITETDPLGRSTVFRYDAVNRLVRTAQPRGSATQHSGCAPWTADDAPIIAGRLVCSTTVAYDGVDNQTARTDANNHTTTFEHDGLHRQTARVVPRAGTAGLRHQTRYDADGNALDGCPPRQSSAGDGICDADALYGTHRLYDDAGRVVEVATYRNATTRHATQTTYDADGNPTAVENARHFTTTATFDLLGRKTSESVPRSTGVMNTTRWVHDPVGNVTAIVRPSGEAPAPAPDGHLIVDGATNPQTNPYRLGAGKRFESVTLRNGGWMAPASGAVAQLDVNGAVIIEAGSGITVAGLGPAGGAGGTSVGMNGANGTGVGPANGGSSTGAWGGGGGGAGHATVGGQAPFIVGGSPGGIGGAAYGDLATDPTGQALLGSGGGGGGRGTTGNGANGGAGGGLIKINAASIDVQGALVADGVPGSPIATPGVGTGGAGGGGSGGSLWLTASTIDLSGTITMAGGAGGTHPSGANGAAGAPGRVRFDTDVLTGTAPAGTVRRAVNRVTAYTYDAGHRLVDTLVGAQSSNAADPGLLPDASGATNVRTRTLYDPDGRVVARYEPRAFTASLADPDEAFMARTDYDRDGRPVAQWVPRFGPAATEPTQVGTTAQRSECAATLRPDASGAVPAYPTGVGICVTKAGFDFKGNRTSLILPTAAGSTASPRKLTFTYTDDDLVSTVASPSPAPAGGTATATHAYDGIGQTLAVTDPLGQTRTSAYSADNLLTRTENPSAVQLDGALATHVTTYAYDHDGQRIQVTDPDNRATATAYLPDGLVESVTDGGGNKTSYAYDEVGNPLSVKSPSANALDATNPAGVATTQSYTADNLLAATTVPVVVNATALVEGRRTGYAYDRGGRKTAQTVDVVNGSGGVVAGRTSSTQRFAYFPDDRLAQETGRNNETITTSYDPAGNPTRVADSTGPAVTATWYLDGLVRSVDDGAARQTYYAYDGAGGRAARADTGGQNTGATTYAYSDAGLVATMTSSTFNGNVAFTYDAAGRPRTEARPDNTTLTWDHYPDDQLKSLVVAKTSPAAELTRWEYNYTNAGQQKTQALTGATFSAGAGTFRYTYDAAGRLASFQHGAAAAKNVRFDADGNRTQYDNEYFDYRADDSLRTQKTGPAGTPVNAAYFDWGGQRSPDGQRTCFTHDGFDRLKTAGTAAVTGNCAGTVTNNATYTYDGLDRQRSRAETLAGTTELHYDGLTSDVVVEKSVTAATDSTYLLGPAGTRHAVTAPLSSLAYNRFWLSDDGHGNISTVTNQSAAITCAARFDPYGTPVNPVNPAAGEKVCHYGSNANTADQSTINDFFYRGGRRDETTDTYQFGARTYNPKQATFLTPDSYRAGDSATNLSVGTDPLTRNSYSYVNGDPVNLLDPDGHAARMYACADSGNGQQYCPVHGSTSGRLVGTAYTSTPQSEKKQDKIFKLQKKIRKMDKGFKPPAVYWSWDLDTRVRWNQDLHGLLEQCNVWHGSCVAAGKFQQGSDLASAVSTGWDMCAIIGLLREQCEGPIGRSAVIDVAAGFAAGPALAGARGLLPRLGGSLAPQTARAVHASDLVESPLWTATKNKTSAQNAYRHFADHGADFPDIQNSVEYVGKAQNFLRTPPGGTLTRVRANGDVVRWHPNSNTFGVMDAGGAPRTFFRPDPSVHGHANNWDYFYAQ